MKDYITVIGGGLAGSEAAYQIAKRGIKVKLYEMKPTKFSPAHHNENLAANACGLLKEELRILDSLLIKTADEVSVPAGQALAVDRELFAEKITNTLENMNNVEIIHQEIGKTGDKSDEKVDNNSIISLKDLMNEGIVIIATGPLTSDALSQEISEIIKEDKLHFYDAAAPIIEKESINMQIAFEGNRYEQERKKEESIEDWNSRLKNQEKSYINLPMSKQEYGKFWDELVKAEVVELHEFEKKEIFEGCMPIEVMAKRGKDTLRYGPLKPVGFTDKRTGKRPYAVVQLRQDNKEGTIYNMVGFQTNLKYGEQKRVFQMIPGLENAEFTKYGVMHRNTFINSPELLDETYQLKSNHNIYFAGQITGVEGYVESISSGMVSALNAIKQFQKYFNIDIREDDIIVKYNEEERIIFSEETMIGALAKYISTPKESFQPMNANFGILPELREKIRDKKQRYEKLSKNALDKLNLL